MSLYAVSLIIVFVWLVVVTGILLYIFSTIRKLSKDTNKKGFITVLNEAIKKGDKNYQDQKLLLKRLVSLENRTENHIQKVGLVRYNPFAETGGDHSFTLSLLDGKLTGVLITCLHTRERTRIYIKDVKAGKSNLELSKEEQQAIDKAI